MANPLQTFRAVIAHLAPDDLLKINGKIWRAEDYHRFIVATGDSRLSYPSTHHADGTIHISNSGVIDTSITVVSKK